MFKPKPKGPLIRAWIARLNPGILRSRLGAAVKVVLFVVALTGVFLYTRVGAPVRVQAATSDTLNFQARLLTNAGGIVPDGDYNVEFKLYSSLAANASLQGVCAGGVSDDCLWLETRTGADKVTVKAGYLSVHLGSVTGFPSTINWDQNLYLTMNIGGTGAASWDGEMSPRLKLTAVPYAFRAGGLTLNNGSDNGNLSFGSVTNNPDIKLPNIAGTNNVLLQSGTTLFTQGSIAFTDANGRLTQDNANYFWDDAANRLGIGDNTPAATLTVGAGDAFQVAGATGNIQTTGDLAVNGGDVTSTTNLNVTASNGALVLTSTGAGNDITLNSADTIELQDSTNITGSLTVSALATFNGGASVTTGQQLTNAGSSLFTAISISDKPSGGDIGTAAATVDGATTFNVNQTTASQTLTLPTPTSTTAGRLAFVNNVGSVSFTMYGSVIATGKSNAFMWNGTTWVTTVSLSGSVVSSIGTIDSQTKSADGAVISSNALFLQTADATYPGLVSTGVQTFTGVKTFNGQIVAGGGIDLGTQTLVGTTSVIDFTNFDVDASGNLDAAGTLTAGTGNAFQVSSGGAVTAVGVNSGTGLLQGTGGLTLTGATLINTTGSANTQIGNATGTFTLDSAALDVTSTGAVSGVTTLDTSGIITLGALGATDTDSYVLCRDASSGQITACDANASGDPFIQGGNTFGAQAILGTNDSNSLAFETNNTTRLTIDTAGAIASTATLTHATTGTTATTGVLHTVNDTVVTTAGTNTTYGQQIAVTRTGSSGGTINTYGLDIQATGDTGGTSTLTGLNVNVSGADTNYAALFSGGNVGINTAAPSSLLTLKASTSTSAGGLRLISNTTNNIVGSLYDSGDNAVFQLGAGGGVGINLLGSGSNYINSGNLGIGDATPAYLFTVGSGDLFGVQSNGDFIWEGTSADANETQLTVQDPTADVTYRLATAVAGTYDICTTANNCAGVAGNNLQQSYDADVDGSDSIIALTSADDSIIIRNPAASGSDSLYALTIDQLSTATKGGLFINHLGDSSSYSLRIDDSSGDSTPLVVDYAGDLGIGTASPAAKLHVFGAHSGGTSFLVTAGSQLHNDSAVLIKDSANVDLFQIRNDGDVSIGTANPTAKLHITGVDSNNNGLLISAGTTSAQNVFAINDLSNATGYFYVKGDGTVGIGDTTPDARLDVEPTGAVTATSYAQQINNLQTNATTDAIDKYGLYISSTGAFTGGAGTATNNYGLYVATPTGGDNNYAAIFAGGNVGIGIANPSSLLTLKASTTDNSGGIRLVANGSTNVIGRLFDNGSDNGTFQLASGGTTNVSLVGSGVSYINGGNFGVGDVTPAALFTVGTSDAFQIDASGNVQTAGTLAVNGDIISGDSNFSIQATGYVRIGDTGTPGVANGDDDLYVEGDLEVDATADFASTISVAGLSTLSGGLSVGRTLGVNSGSTQNVGSITFSSPADTSGTNVSNGLNITPTIGNATAGTNTANIINVGAVTGDAQVSLNALNIGNLTGTAASEYALNVGSGWDAVLRVNGTDVINGTGQVISTGITGTLFSTNTDTASANTIVQGDTLSILGGTTGIDVTHSGDTITVDLDTTEIASTTFGGGSGFLWTFDAPGVDPTIGFGNDIIIFGSNTTGFSVTPSTGALTDIDGNLILNDQTDIGSATTGIRVATTGSVSDIDGNLVLADTLDLGSATTGINLTTAGVITDIDGNVVVDDTVDLGSATTGLNITTGGVLSDIDANLVLNDQTDIGSAATGIRVATTGSILDIDGDLVLNDQLNLGSATTGLQITTDGIISDLDDADVQISDDLTVSGLATISGGSSVNRTLSVNSGSTQNVSLITFTTPADTSGTNVSNGLNITPTIGNATAGTNTANIINVGAVTGDAQVSLNALSIGALTGTAANEYALSVGAGWDSVLRVGGTEVINGSGQVLAAQITGTLFTTTTDSGGSNNIDRGDTLTLQGTATGIDVTNSSDTVTVALDTTEIGTSTFGAGSGFTWTFDASAGTDTSLTFGNDQITVAGNIVATDDKWIGFGSAAGRIEFDDQATDEINFRNVRVGFGTSTPGGPVDIAPSSFSDANLVSIASTANSTSIGQKGISVGLTVTPGSATSQTFFGVDSFVNGSNSNTATAGLYGYRSLALYNGSAQMTGSFVGGTFSAQNQGTAIVDNAYGIQAGVQNQSSGSITNGYAMFVPSGGSGITNNYGLYIQSQTAGTNDYGVYVQAADTYALFIDSGTSRFDGQLIINGVATDITTGTNEDLTVVADGSGKVIVNDSLQVTTLTAGLVKSDGSGNLSIATGGTDYEVPLTFNNGLTRTTNTVALGGSLNANTTLGGGNAYTLGVTSDLSGGGRTTSAFTVSQANNASNDLTTNALVDFSNSDTGSTVSVLKVTQNANNAAAISVSTGANGTGVTVNGVTSGVAYNSSATTGTSLNVTGLTSGKAVWVGFNSNVTTGIGLQFDTTSLGMTSASALTASGTASGALSGYTGKLIDISPVRTNTATSGTITDSGNFLNLTRANTQNGAGGTFAITGALANLQSNCTQTAGTCTDTSNILSLNQQYGSATGDVISLSNSGTGSNATFTSVNTAGTQTNGVAITRNGGGGTTTNLLNLTNTAGTVTNGIAFSGTYTNLINSSVFNVSNGGTVTASNSFDRIGASGTLGIGSSVATTLNIGSNGASNPIVNIDSGTSAINIGTGAQARSVNLGTGAATQAVAIGSSSASSTTAIQGGTGASAVTIQAASGGTITVGSAAASTVNIGTGAFAHTIAIGTDGTTTQGITIGSSSASSTTTIQGGTGASALVLDSGASSTITIGNSVVARTINIGTVAAAQTITIGSTNTSSSTYLFGGTGGVALATGNNASGQSGAVLLATGTGTTGTGDYILGSGNASAGTSGFVVISTGSGTVASGALSFTTGNASAGTAGQIAIDTGTSSSGSGAINIGTANAGALILGNTAAATTTTIRGGTGASALALQAGSGGTITIGASAAATVNIGTGAFAHTIAIGNDATTNQGITIGSTSGTSSLLLQSGTGDVAITSQDDINIGTNAVAQDITIGNTTAATSVTVNTGAGANFAINGTSTATSGTVNGTVGTLTVSPASGPGTLTQFYGGLFSANSSSSNVNANTILYGIGGAASYSGTGTIGVIAGSNSIATLGAAGTANIAVGTGGGVAISAGTIVEGSALYAGSPTLGGGTITTAYGLHVKNQGGSGVTNAVGLYVDTQSGAATTNYAAIFQGGNVGIGTVAPTSLLHVVGAQPASVAVAGTAATAVLGVSGGQGGNTTGTTGQTAGAGAAISVVSGGGGNASGATGANIGGAGGAFAIATGAGGTIASTNNSAVGGNGGALTINTGAGGAGTGASGNYTGGNGGALSVTAGAGGAVTSATGVAGTGGVITIQGGTGGTGGSSGGNGGNLNLLGGTGGRGVKGLVVVDTATFSAAVVQNFTGSANITQANIDTYGTILISSNAASYTATLTDPTITTAGRLVYVTNTGSFDMTLSVNGGGTGNTVTLKPSTTATMIWNGVDWTAAGASSSTDLQAAYNNTATSAGGAELVLNASGGAADGLTIRNNATTPISGGILEVQSSIGTNLFSVNSLGTELAANGGAETSSSFNTDWTTIGNVSASRSRTTTAGQFVTGLAGASVTTTANANDGIRNNLSGNPVVSTTYTVSFAAKLASGTFSTLQVAYTRDGGTNFQTCSSYSTQTLSTSVWTKVTCTITTDGTTATNPDLVIRQTDATVRTFYIDNLSFIRNDSSTQPSNVQIGGGINGGQVTLFTLDRATAPPVANGDTTYLGSMYYDTTTGRIQCYESDGWGACGSAPDNIITLTPEYTGAVLNGSGVGTMTADFCANETSVLVVGSLCATHEARNFYRWTSPQATSQTYSIYVTYKLPSTFKTFSDSNTIKLTAYKDHATNAGATLEVYRKNVSGNTISQCGSTTTITTGTSTWNQTSLTGDETACSWAGGDYVIFKINATASNNANVYIENLDFTYTNN